MRRLVCASLVLCLAACGTSTRVATLADGRTGTFPILTATYPTVPGAVEQPATVTAELSAPEGAGRVPAVIVLHSCAGVTPSIGAWAQAVNHMGYAALVVDSFTRRGVKEVCTGHTSVSVGSRLADLFRAHELLATHPRIDARRIAVLGFDHGGWAALWASHEQYQRVFVRGTVPLPVAYAAFYPAGCNAQLLDETDVTAPVRIFQGTADDWTIVEHCRAWVARRRAAGRDVTLVEYPGAMHGFDNPAFAQARYLAEVVNASGCTMLQRADRVFADADGRRFSGASPCMGHGGSMAYDARAHQQSIEDLAVFFRTVFRAVR